MVDPLPSDTSGDDQRLRFTATVERAIAQLYDEARLLGHLDGAAEEIATRFASHHRLHAQSLEVDADISDTQPNAAFLAELSPQLRAAGSSEATLLVLQHLEQAIAATHLEALGILHYAASAGTVAEILPIECEHSVVLGLLLDQPLADLTTATGDEPTAGAVDPARYPAP